MFSLMDPVPPPVKLSFHVFGLACALLALVLAVFVAGASECAYSTPELYALDFAAAAAGLGAAGGKVE